MYKSDIQFIREKYCELADENNKLRDEIRVLKENKDELLLQFTRAPRGESVELDGRIYEVFSWREPKDCADISIGEVCLGLYPAAYAPFPLRVCCDGNCHFENMEGSPIEIEPLFVLQLPRIGETALIQKDENIRLQKQVVVLTDLDNETH